MSLVGLEGVVHFVSRDTALSLVGKSLFFLTRLDADSLMRIVRVIRWGRRMCYRIDVAGHAVIRAAMDNCKCRVPQI